MLEGFCSYCHQPNVFERSSYLPMPAHHHDPLPVRLLACATCGYTEIYTQAGHLAALAQSPEWMRVPPQQAVGDTVATGETVRLEPPSPGSEQPAPVAAPELAPKRRCPACQSAAIIPKVHVLDRSQSLSQQLSVEVAARPDAVLFRNVISSGLSAWTCGECGYTSLFADRPAELYQAYKDSRR